MNISTSYQYQVYNSELNTAQTNLFQATQQESTGLAINVPSDNPVGSEQVANMQSLEDTLNQYQSNLSSAKGVLTVTDSALQTAQQVMVSAKTIALQGANATTLDPSTVKSLVAQITTLQQSLVAAGNTQGPDGQYIFAGQKSDTQPFSTNSNGQLQFAGDDKPVTVQAGPSDTIQTNVAGGQLFSAAYSALSNLKSDLESGNVKAISDTDVAAITSASSAISDADGTIGSTTDQVESLTSFNTQRITELTSGISGIKDINIATAATNYQQASTAYQAALEVVSKASNLSLMNYLSTTSL
jgi:flagellar hook-associated protein 3 FlgL